MATLGPTGNPMIAKPVAKSILRHDLIVHLIVQSMVETAPAWINFKGSERPLRVFVAIAGLLVW